MSSSDPLNHYSSTNTSVNSARNTAVAVFVGDWTTSQLWLFWVVPIIGAILGALIYRLLRYEKNYEKTENV